MNNSVSQNTHSGFTNAGAYRFGLVVLCTVSAFAFPESAFAASSASDVFNTGPLDNIIQFLTGPVARFIAILAVFALGAMIMFGQGFQGFGQRVPTVLIGIIFVIGAVTAVDFFIGGSGSSGASLSINEFSEAHEYTQGTSK